MQTTSESILIRPIAGDGFSEVKSVEHQGQNAPWPDESLHAELIAGNAFHFGLYGGRDERLFSFVLARKIIDEVHIHRVCTHPLCRRAGFARMLLGHVLYTARSRGARLAFLEVAASNTAALALYRQIGFAENATRKNYYSTGDDAITMDKSLVTPEPPKGTTR